jgi:uncharacterized protein YbjT (DUF2867 family)
VNAGRRPATPRELRDLLYDPPVPRHTALIAGATGLVGRACLERLLDHASYGLVVAVVRRAPEVVHQKLRVVVADFDHLDETALPEVDHAFCALGTTIARAGSQEAFRRVDRDAVVAFARLARAHGATQLALVSSVGADASSSNFYLRVKGEAERELAASGFDGLHVLRPGLLLGDRRESRPAEAVARALLPWLNPLLAGGLRRYRSVDAGTVAEAMIGAALEGTRGVRILEHDDIERLAAIQVSHPSHPRR